MPRSKEFLLEQIARIQRFATAMSNEEDRARFEKLAADYRRELEAVEAQEGRSSVVAASDEASTETATAEAAGDTDVSAPDSASATDDQPLTRD
ncbi:hypothetical protein [Bradyrhizobium elkanii]|uniref:Uncharacterized protein n=1 Tax=Bradyrhizobium elkanii TaxID=29448 RepID=A0A8I1Y6B4_BRAEL|nr:hypothetical protein [Bradyrhizobium elkanii]MBP1294208.1 hypothetical protein [Bradyrhizobium elkanii]